MLEAGVSVITVNFNAGPALTACVRSVLASTVEVEQIVVDNGSTDDSLALLRGAIGTEPRVRIVEAGQNLGFARANNRGLSLAGGSFLLFLNPDSVVEPETIARMRRAMETHPEAGLTPNLALGRAFGLSRFFGAEHDFILTGTPLPSGPIEVEAISGAFMFVRRAALVAVGPLDERYFLHCEDLDWCVRFRQAGWRVLFVPDARVVHDKGLSSRGRPVRVLWHLHLGMVRFYRKFFRNAYPAPVMWLVFAGITLRFGALALLALLRRGNAPER